MGNRAIDLLDPTAYSAFLDVRGTFPARHWSGTPDPMYSEDGRAAVLSCTCGDFGCGGLSGQIDVHDWFVVWKNFTEANYGESVPMPTYRFDRARYFEQIRRIEERA